MQKSPEEFFPGLDILQGHPDLVTQRDMLITQFKEYAEQVRQVAAAAASGDQATPRQPDLLQLGQGGGNDEDDDLEEVPDDDNDQDMPDHDDGGPHPKRRPGVIPDHHRSVQQGSWPSSTARSFSAPPSTTTPSSTTSSAKAALIEQSRKDARERARLDADPFASARESAGAPSA